MQFNLYEREHRTTKQVDKQFVLFCDGISSTWNEKLWVIQNQLTVVGPAEYSRSFERDLCIVEAEARVHDFVSSITWAYKCLFERKTLSLGLSVVPLTWKENTETWFTDNNISIYIVNAHHTIHHPVKLSCFLGSCANFSNVYHFCF